MKNAMGTLECMQKAEEPVWKILWIQSKLSQSSQAWVYKGLSQLCQKPEVCSRETAPLLNFITKVECSIIRVLHGRKEIFYNW